MFEIVLESVFCKWYGDNPVTKAFAIDNVDPWTTVLQY